MIFGHLKIASSIQDNPETILRYLRNVLLKTYQQHRCLQDIFKKALSRLSNLKTVRRCLEDVLKFLI